jgi:hypothetical protein
LAAHPSDASAVHLRVLRVSSPVHSVVVIPKLGSTIRSSYRFTFVK